MFISRRIQPCRKKYILGWECVFFWLSFFSSGAALARHVTWSIIMASRHRLPHLRRPLITPPCISMARFIDSGHGILPTGTMSTLNRFFCRTRTERAASPLVAPRNIGGTSNITMDTGSHHPGGLDETCPVFLSRLKNAASAHECAPAVDNLSLETRVSYSSFFPFI